MTTIVGYENCNTKDFAVFKETFIIGENWLHDKTRHDLLAWTKDNKVYEYHEYYDEDIDDIVEDSQLIKELSSRDEAISFIKEYYNVTKVKA